MRVLARNIVLCAATLAGCGGSVTERTSNKLRSDAGTSVGGAGGSNAGAGGAGAALGGVSGQPPNPPFDAATPEDGGAAACQIHKAETYLTVADCYACLGTGCVGPSVLPPFTTADCPRLASDPLFFCVWYPDCSADHRFSEIFSCASPTGCVLCYVNF